jgi:hypothetical protein
LVHVDEAIAMADEALVDALPVARAAYDAGESAPASRDLS